MTSPLPRECSTTKLQGPTCCPLLQSNQGTSNKNFGAGEGNRTLIISLEGFSSTIELHPQGRQPRPLPLLNSSAKPLSTTAWWRGLDSNQRTRKRADLQSAAINHSATPPQEAEQFSIEHCFCQLELSRNPCFRKDFQEILR